MANGQQSQAGQSSTTSQAATLGQAELQQYLLAAGQQQQAQAQQQQQSNRWAAMNSFGYFGSATQAPPTLASQTFYPQVAGQFWPQPTAAAQGATAGSGQ